MPEMPEVQAMVERLEAAVGGGAFLGATALQFSGLKTFEPRPESLLGLRVTGVGRRGKFALFEFDGWTASWTLRECARGEPVSYPLEFHGTRGTLGITRSGSS